MGGGVLPYYTEIFLEVLHDAAQKKNLDVFIFPVLTIKGQPHSFDFNHCILTYLTDSHWEPRNKVGSLTPAKRLVGFEPVTF